MLSVQNTHLLIEENPVEHAARRGGGRRGTRPSARGGVSRWALGVGAATGGIALMGRNRRVRKLARKVIRSKAMRKVRGAVVGGLRKVRSTSAVRTARRFVGARKVSVKRIGTSVAGAARRVYARSAAKASKAFGRVKARATGVKRYVTGARKRTTIAARRVTSRRTTTRRMTSRSASRRRR